MPKIKYYLAMPFNDHNIMLTYTFEDTIPEGHYEISKELYDELLEQHQTTHCEIRQSGSEPFYKCYTEINQDPDYYWDVESESFKLKEDK